MLLMFIPYVGPAANYMISLYSLKVGKQVKTALYL